MAATESVDTLSPDEAQRLTEFARACKAAARIVVLYPATHPTIQSALNRVADGGQRLRGQGAATLTVMPDAVWLDGRAPVKPDSSLGELASLLHAHLIGELTLHGELGPTAWHTFLTLLAKAPEVVRADGGIARAWMTSGGGPIDLKLIDYAEVLRERSGGSDSAWNQIIANYLEGDLSNIDETSLGALLELANDTARFKDFTEQFVGEASKGGQRGKKEVVLRVLQALADYTAKNHPEQLDKVLNQISGTLPRLTPDLVVTLITTGILSGSGAGLPGIDLPGEIRARLSDRTVAEFVAHSVERDHGATARLAQAFQALVPEGDKRTQLLEMAELEAANLPIGKQPEFPDLWKSAAGLLTSYSDSNYVSEEYGKELATARAHAIEVERVSDDPPERLAAWLSTVGEKEVRRLDQQVLLDLLTIETRADAWHKVLDSALAAIDQLILLGHVGLAQELLDAILKAGEDDAPFAEQARGGLEQLRTGALVRHVVLSIREAQEDEVKAISAFCRSLGPPVIGPLAEALAVEQGSAVKRLREILLSFGAAGRAYADELRTSANPAVRRTAIELLRAFGGADALPDLARLLDDSEAAVQREALRAIIQIGTDEAYATLEHALKSSPMRTRDAIMQALSASRDERAAPLFLYILSHSDYRGNLETVYLGAVEALGKVGGDADSVAALVAVLNRGEWWAPWRTARLRQAAASALRTCGTPRAQQALEDAAKEGPRGVRRAARVALNAPAPRMPARRTS